MNGASLDELTFFNTNFEQKIVDLYFWLVNIHTRRLVLAIALTATA